MESREQLEKRVAELEKQVSAFKAGGPLSMRGIRKRATWGIGDIPFYDIASGPISRAASCGATRRGSSRSGISPRASWRSAGWRGV